MSVLAKGPNFSLAPNDIPNIDCITAVESMCTKLKEEDAMELRANINALLRKAKGPKPNLTKEERIGSGHGSYGQTGIHQWGRRVTRPASI